MTDRTTYLVPSENLAKFEAACAKLSRKAVKLGCDEIKPFVFGHTMQTLADGREHRVYEVFLTAEPVKVDGWQFVATLDHANETGNIVRTVPNTGVEIPQHYRDSKPYCNHCNANRRRRSTFLLQNTESKNFISVGSTCLKDFFGHDPLKAARLAELLGYAHEAGLAAQDLDSTMVDLRWIRVETYCQRVAQVIRLHGWVSGKAAYENPALTPSSRMATAWYNHGSGNGVLNIADPSDEDKALAAEALAWAESLRDKENKSDYEHNILVVAEAEVMESRSAGLAASIVGVFLQHKAREAERLVKEAAQKDSQHIGAVGDKLVNLPVTMIGFNTSAGNYGDTYIYRMLTDDGNVLTWFASNPQEVEIGGKMLLKTATVKKHDAFRGVALTVVTRCKLAVVL